jgi:signal transduction histidine kinase
MTTDAEFSLFDINSWKSQMAQGKIYHYLWAIIIILFIAWVKVSFPDYDALKMPFLLFVFGVFISAYIGGVGPGLLSVLLSASLASYLFLPPYRSLQIEPHHRPALILYIIGSSILVVLVSRQRRTIYQKAAMERQKDDFISSTSHELKTPLTSMKIFVELLEKQAATQHLDDKTKKYVGMISEQTDRLISLVNVLLDITRVNTNRLELKRELVDINRLVGHLVESMQTTVTTHNFILEGQVRRKIRGDELRLTQVVSNILSNAVKYSPNDSTVKVVLKEEKDTVVISIADQGIGIDRAFHKKIFDRFYRVHEKGTVFSGLGIGLYLTSEIVKMHGGKIRVESEVGKGSTFHLIFPTKE